MEPRVLLMDEPTASLDPARRGDLAAILRRLAADNGCALLIASHDEEFVRGCAHRVLAMANGRITQVSA
jgi:ABC-type sulfate/molybdate transport systems ATPase subunit